jgi:hypothetical protein
MSHSSLEGLIETWPLLEVPESDDFVDGLLSLLEENDEDHRPSEESNNETAISKEQRKSKKIKLKEEQLDLQCEWRECDYRTCNLDHFVRHVSLHIPHLEVKVNKDQEGTVSVLFNQLLFIVKIFQKYLVV